ncbi:MAG: hypothetical protein ACREOM_04315 [Candidatus Dormibacteraceae bacterium]
MFEVPCSPVESPDNACTGRAAPGVEIDYANGAATSKTVTDPKGAYSIQLAAGTWKVTLKSPLRIVSGPASVTVAAGSNAVANYTVDTGIRLPVPQQ